MDRIPYIKKDEVEGGAAEAWNALPFDLALFHITAHAQNVFPHWLKFNGAAMGQSPTAPSTLDPLLKELAVVHTSALSSSPYEWGNHSRAALGAGATQAQVDALVKTGDIAADVFDEKQKLVLRFTTEIVNNVRASEETLTAMAQKFTNRQIVELIFAICTYMMNSRLAENGGLALGDDARFDPRFA